MKKYEMKNYKELENLKEGLEQEFIINLENCEVKDKAKIICFISGLTFLNGDLRKLNKDEFQVKLEREKK